MPTDPFQMAMIHRAFRVEFGNLPGLIRAIMPGDTRRARFVGNYLDNMIAVLHHHHGAEDALLWPILGERIPRSDAEIRRAQDDHIGIAELVDKVQSVRTSWMGSAEPPLAEQLAAAVTQLSVEANEHFDYEEQKVLPLIGEHIAPGEWQAFVDRGAAYVRPRNLWFALAYAGVLLRDATPDERRRFDAALPFALRMVLKLLGGRAYRRYQAELYGIHA